MSPEKVDQLPQCSFEELAKLRVSPAFATYVPSRLTYFTRLHDLCAFMFSLLKCLTHALYLRTLRALSVVVKIVFRIDL